MKGLKMQMTSTAIARRYLSAADSRIAIAEPRRGDVETAVGSLQGYAAVFNYKSLDLGGFVEVVRPQTFARALRERQDVVALFNHETSQILGRVSAGTLRLSEDAIGLRYEIVLADTTLHRDLHTLVARRDIKSSSFSFRVKRDEWKRENGQDVRYLLDVDLFDVSPVTSPAYPAASVGARDHEDPDARRQRRIAEQAAKLAATKRERMIRMRLAGII
jgi:HK97 family phage prohead protease